MKKFAQKNNINDEDLKYIDISTILNSETNLSLEKFKSILIKQIKQNKKNYSLLKLIKLPDVINSRKDVYYFKVDESKINFVTNKDIFGKIIYLNNFSSIDLNTLKNKILVIENADPGYDFIFSYNIKGLITKYGGPNSHLAIRCEELSIPAAIGVGNIFENLVNKTNVEINCSTQEINYF